MFPQKSFFEKVKHAAGNEDIDFDDHLEFSDMFLVKGDNEEGIRKFFKSTLITLVEQS